MNARFDAVGGAMYAAMNALKLLLLFASVFLLCKYALGMFAGSVGAEWSVRDLLSTALRYASPAAVLIVISFIAGGFAPGDPLRLAGRLAVCLWMLAYLILLGDGMSYAMTDVLLDGATARTISLTVSPDLLVILLAIVPVLSAADAYLEYREPSTTGPWITRIRRSGSENDGVR